MFLTNLDLDKSLQDDDSKMSVTERTNSKDLKMTEESFNFIFTSNAFPNFLEGGSCKDDESMEEESVANIFTQTEESEGNSPPITTP